MKRPVLSESMSDIFDFEEILGAAHMSIITSHMMKVRIHNFYSKVVLNLRK
jgi:hypothetical protein